MNKLLNDLELDVSRQILNDSLCDQDEIYPSNLCKQDSKRKATQLVTVLIFIFGIFFAVLIYCKSCTRTSARYSQNDSCESEHTRRIGCEEGVSSRYYTLLGSRDRPPSYSEACSAPPLYAAPFNRISMLEAPPVYPDTPKLSDRQSYSGDQGVPITHHI